MEAIKIVRMVRVLRFMRLLRLRRLLEDMSVTQADRLLEHYPYLVRFAGTSRSPIPTSTTLVKQGQLGREMALVRRSIKLARPKPPFLHQSSVVGGKQQSPLQAKSLQKKPKPKPPASAPSSTRALYTPKPAESPAVSIAAAAAAAAASPAAGLTASHAHVPSPGGASYSPHHAGIAADALKHGTTTLPETGLTLGKARDLREFARSHAVAFLASNCGRSHVGDESGGGADGGGTDGGGTDGGSSELENASARNKEADRFFLALLDIVLVMAQGGFYYNTADVWNLCSPLIAILDCRLLMVRQAVGGDTADGEEGAGRGSRDGDARQDSSSAVGEGDSSLGGGGAGAAQALPLQEVDLLHKQLQRHRYAPDTRQKTMT